MQKLFTTLLLISSFIATTNLFAQDSSKTKSLNEVIITGQYKPQSVKNSVYQVRVISNQKIQLSGATNVQQALNTELGLRFSSDRIIGTDLKINGISGRDVKILVDGVPLSDRSDERLSLGQIDVNTIERIELVEGPMSVSYGTDAMAGVINIITKKNYLNGLSVNARAQEETIADQYYPFSYHGVHTQNLGVIYKKSAWNFTAGGTHIDFNGYGGDQYGRNKSWLPKEQWMGNGKVGYSNSKFNIYYKVDGLKETIEDRSKLNLNLDPGFPFARATDKTYRTERFMHQLQSEYRFSKNVSWNSILSYTDLKRATVTLNKELIAHTVALDTSAAAQDISKLNTFTFKNTVQYQINNKISLQPGIDIVHEKATGQRITGEPSITDYAFFASAEYKPTAKINIRPGLRFEKNSVYDAPSVIPSLNTKFTFNKNLDLRLAYGRGFRAPVLRELFFTFHDVNHSIDGNPNLKAETSNSVNGSLTWTAPKLKSAIFTSRLGAFYSAFKNQITLVSPAVATDPYTYKNIGKSRTLSLSLMNNFTYKSFDAGFGFNYTGYEEKYSANTVKSDNKDFLWSPEANANLSYKVKKIQTSFGLFYKFVGNQPQFVSDNTAAVQPALALRKSDSYHLADFTIINASFKHFTINGGVKNIFNVTDVTSNINSGSVHSSGNNLSVSYGRSYFLGLAFHRHQK